MTKIIARNIRKVIGTSTRPRVAVFRSNRDIVAQVVDDSRGTSLFASSSASIEGTKKPVEKAFVVGQEIAKLAKSKRINELVYDRRDYLYHGQVKALAEGIRDGGVTV